jgi:hypothetical protein
VSVEDDERSGRQSTRKTKENVEKIQELIHEDTTGISNGVRQETLTED